MVAASLIDQDRRDEASNFGVSKARMQFLLDEHGLKEFVTTSIAVSMKISKLKFYFSNWN